MCNYVRHVYHGQQSNCSSSAYSTAKPKQYRNPWRRQENPVIPSEVPNLTDMTPIWVPERIRPCKGPMDSIEKCWAYLKGVGFVLTGNRVECSEYRSYIDILVEVQLPIGWKCQFIKKGGYGYDNPGDSYGLIDDKGRLRVILVYLKWDLAYMDLIGRFTLEPETTVVYTNVLDTGSNSQIYRTNTYPPQLVPGLLNKCKGSVEEAQDWLKSEYPEWENPAAYWDV